MLMAKMPIAVIMQRRTIQHRWVDTVWAAVGVVPDSGNLAPVQPLSWTPERESYLVSGLQLELYPDENDGYFENWAAPEPKVFVMWRMQQERAMPIVASVSYGEGTRMLDSGESADGVAMPGEIYVWLTHYLQKHYQPRQHRGRQHG
jgi:hypothetical protein